MGKEDQDSISLELKPGCMRGIFHHINHPKWHYVKKRLPYKRHKSGSNSPVVGEPDNDSNTNASTEGGEKVDGGTADSEVKKSSESSSVHKSSMKSKLKSFTDEVSKRRGRHRRCSSDPARLPPEKTASNSNHHIENSKLDYCVIDPVFPSIRNESSSSKTSQIDVKDHTILKESLVYAVDKSKNTSNQDSKIFLDALDLLNIRKEFFLKVLHDPKSSLSLHLRRHKASIRKSRFHKSLSFPVSGLSGENHKLVNVSDTNSTNGLIIMPTIKCHAHESTIENDKSLDSKLDHKERRSNKLVMKRFKMLRDKVKHAIKENKKERYRIIMDSILDKVPYGRGYAKGNKQEVIAHPKSVTDKYIKYRSVSSLNRKQLCPEKQQMRRTSSFNESLERYNRLLEVCLSKEEEERVCDRSIQTTGTTSHVGRSPASLQRILSLPDLRCYSLSQFEESPSTSDFPTEMLSRAYSRRIDLESSYLHGNELGGTRDDLKRLKKHDEAFSKSEVDASETCSTMFTANEDLEPMVEDSTYQYDDDFDSCPHEFSAGSTASPETRIVTNQEETQMKMISDNMQRIQVDTRIKNEFNYVRDVLKLSGFNGDEFFKKWNFSIDQQPLDPSMFEDFLLAHTKCSGNVENRSWNRIHLFDLINEVLLDMSRRSFSYWPVPLTYSCHTQRIPVGYHVLEEVWKNISCCLSGPCETEESMDSSVIHDLSKADGWMNLQFEAECVGIELEEWIFDDLLDEIL